MGEFGAKGVLVMVYLLPAVYSKGYFLQWNELSKMQLANRVNAKPELVDQVVNRLVVYGTFDKDLFNSAKVLTSLRIQETYIEAIKRRKGKKPTEYWLIPTETKPKRVNANINPSKSDINVNINVQSKGNKSKGNKSKKDTSPKYGDDSPFLILARKLLEKIKVHNPDHKKLTKAQEQSWADTIRKTVELDKRTMDQVSRMIDWCQSDDFWYKVILSPTTLRNNYDKMAAQANDEVKKQKKQVKETLPGWASKPKSNEPVKSTPLTSEQQDELARRLAALQSGGAANE